jgi:hypothetical protein
MASVTKASIKSKLRQSNANYMDDLADSIVTLTDTQTISGNTTQNALILGTQAVTAAGGSQGAAGAITQGSGAVVIVTAADNSKGVRLPLLSACSTGEVYLVMNNLSNKTLEIFPGSGDAINVSSDNTAITVAADTITMFIKMDSAEWFGAELPVVAA